MDTPLIDYLTTDPKSIQDVKVALANPQGKVLITSRLALDLMESDESIGFFTVSASGRMTAVKEYAGPEWELLLVSIAAHRPPVAVIEREDVYGANERLAQLVASGKSLIEAVVALLP